ncbi:MAG TPA: ATP-dependent DNA helicase [Sporichthyaceae bacterium]|nr:ATP-dependent DNA helicase [Sporichthyaceae bacterium]
MSRREVRHGGARLVRGPAPVADPPRLDPAQRAVVDHSGGPLLVLAGPGTGKTTTLVEAVAARVARGVDPGRILVLTFSRKAAGELRDRIGRRLARTTVEPAAWTFHAFGLALLNAARGQDLPPLRVLSGAEQDVAVRELLRGSTRTPAAIDWPEEIAAALGTRGLADEVEAVLARIAERDVELRALVEADPAGAARWSALADFADTYLDVIDARGMLDHAGLIRRALYLLEEPAARAAIRARYDVVLVDEYQDVDPAQVRLLRQIAGDGRELIAFGDPDQSIYAFRGAEVREILEFGDRFRALDGTAAPTVVLEVSRRATPGLLAASRQVARRLPVSGLSAAVALRHRGLRSVLPPGPESEVEVRLFGSAAAELSHVADVLRRAHLEEGTPWSAMAVLVRSGVRDIPAVRRVLGAAGIPLFLALDEVPVRAEPAVATLLTGLQVVADPAAVAPDLAAALMLSPLAGLDPVQLRTLGRRLRQMARSVGKPAASASELLRDALADPDSLDLDDPVAAAVRGLARLLAGAAQAHAGGAGPHDVLWHLWSGTDWPDRLERSALGGGPAAARADRDLDAVCALFTLAEQAQRSPGRPDLRHFLTCVAASEVPFESPGSAARGVDAVAVMTAHRAKGLEWPLVAVVRVQEGCWPDLRRRGTLLSGDRITSDGLAPPPSVSATLAEERRLFYVAVTRARARLLVTAVSGGDSEQDRPSRFVHELGVAAVEDLQTGRRALSAAALAAELRSVVTDASCSDSLRSVAAARLARLAAARDPDGRRLAPAAHPDAWWGVLEPSLAPQPLRAAERPLDLSPSAVEGLTSCPLRWFLGREVGAASAPSAPTAVGSLLHALAEQAGSAVSAEQLAAQLRDVWDQVPFEADWQSEQQQEEATGTLEAFLTWHGSRPDRSLLGVEVPFRVELEAGDTTVRLGGRIDRVERDARGAVRVVDLKTGRTAVSKADVADNPALGAYQLAVQAGALADLDGADGPSGGAELVMLRQPDRTGKPKIHTQAAAADPEVADRFAAQLGAAARRVRAERFDPEPSAECDMCEFRRCCSAHAHGGGLA